jgi:hypothetical protein
MDCGMDAFERIVYGIIVVAVLSLFATFYLLDIQTEVPARQPLQGLVNAAAAVTVFLFVLGFVILFLNRRMSTAGFA